MRRAVSRSSSPVLFDAVVKVRKRLQSFQKSVRQPRMNLQRVRNRRVSACSRVTPFYSFFIVRFRTLKF